MAIEEIHIWCTARLLITLHGDNATFVAAQRLDALLATGDLDGRIAWRRIAKAVKGLMAKKQPRGATMH